MFDLEPALEAALSASGDRLVAGSRFGLGLSKAEPFDWRVEWAAALDRARPDLVIVLQGVWDARTVTVDGQVLQPGSAEWTQWYRSLVAEALQVLTAGGATVEWIATLPEPDPAKDARIDAVNEVAYSVVRSWPGAIWIDGPAALASAPGQGPLRKVDGEHLCPRGAAALAAAAMAAGGDRLAGPPTWVSGSWRGDSRYAADGGCSS